MAALQMDLAWLPVVTPLVTVLSDRFFRVLR